MKTMEVAENVIQYEVPQVQVIEVEVENGFQASGSNDAWEEE